MININFHDHLIFLIDFPINVILNLSDQQCGQTAEVGAATTTAKGSYPHYATFVCSQE